MIKRLWKHTRLLFLLSIVLSVFAGLSIPVRTYFIQNLIDFAVLENKNGSLGRQFILFSALLLMILLIGSAVDKLLILVNLKLRNRLEKAWGQELFSMISTIDYSYFETQDTYVVIDRISSNFKTKAIDAIDAVALTISLSVTLIGIITYIFNAGFEVVIILLITSIPIWFLSVRSSFKERDQFCNYYPYYLKANYLSSIINSREFIKESRIYGYKDYIAGLWKESLSSFQKGVFTSNLKERNITAMFIMLQYIAVTGVIFTLIIPFDDGTVTIGFIIATAQVLWIFVGDLQHRIITIIQKLQSFRYFEKDFSKVEGYKSNSNHTGNMTISFEFESAEFKDVWFRYEDQLEWILKGINFTIHRGQTIALVGTNGCGKSTIIKLLLGLLTPSSGQILINGIDLQSLDIESRKRVFAAIFQDYAKYNITLRENIAFDSQAHEGRIRDILSKITDYEYLVKHLPKGQDTVLGKGIDGGMDLSGGQWQTIVIARALYADTQLIIMDEPTSSLDPIAECEVFKQLSTATKGKTAIYVTHRLGSARFANTIFTLENGKIIEKGSHDVLMKMGGTYAKMYDMQKQWYERPAH